MLSEEYLEALADPIVQDIEELNSYYIDLIAGSINQDTLNSIRKSQLESIIVAGASVTELQKRIAEVTKKSEADIIKIFDDLANENWKGAETFAKIQGKDFIPYKDNSYLKSYVSAVAKQTNDTFKNLSNTSMIGTYVQKAPNTKPVFMNTRQTFIEIIDKAVNTIGLGYGDRNRALRGVLKSAASSGLKTAIYQNDGKRIYTQDIGSAARRNINDGVRSITQGIQNYIGEQYGADAKEISVHVACAPDHIALQGRIFSNEEYAKIDGISIGGATGGGTVKDIYNNYLGVPTRPISIWNCKHYAFAFIVGVSTPAFSPEIVADINARNEKGWTDTDNILGDKDKHYTTYDVTQEMRAIERATRDLSRQYKIMEQTGDKEEAAKLNSKIKANRKTYRNLLESAKDTGVQAHWDRFVT